MSHHEESSGHSHGFHGPRCWIVSTLAGLLLGLLASGLISVNPAKDDGLSPDEVVRVREIDRVEGKPAVGGDSVSVERLPSGHVRPWRDAKVAGSIEADHADDGHSIPVPVWLCVPFALLLGSIAMMPFVHLRFWLRHFPDFAFFLGTFVTGFYLGEFGSPGRHAIMHAVIEYYSFIALVGGLFVVSGGILIDVRTRATPWANVGLLAVGALLANIVGTTGASMLLIRPFMRMNEGRLKPIHVVMFIFIVSNCAGCLTPIGDPPLYLGFLKGVPFEWTLARLWPMWLVCVGLLLVVFFAIDTRIGSGQGDKTHGHPVLHRGDYPAGVRRTGLRIGPVLVNGLPALGYLALMVLGVFIDPALKKFAGVEGWPVGATFQLMVAATAYFTADREILKSNAFNFHPVQEVGFLFVGIFLTMVPALGYLAKNAGSLGLESPGQFYFFTGALSAVLDNAPTYLNFLQSAMGVLHLPLDSDGIQSFITHSYELVHADGSVVRFEGEVLLEAISLGAVFFGAMTYIGNGPNFMVKSISEANGVRMPSFFAYLGYSCVVLLPILVVVWAIFI